MYGNTYALPSKDIEFISIPRWYQYCLGIDLTRKLVSFAINGIVKSANNWFASIQNPASKILQSKLIAYNEMFSYVNIHSSDINKTNVSALGNILAWNIDSWNYTKITGFNIATTRDFSMILGASDGSFSLVIQSPMNFETLNSTCNRIGPGVRIKTNLILNLNFLVCFKTLALQEVNRKLHNSNIVLK